MEVYEMFKYQKIEVLDNKPKINPIFDNSNNSFCFARKTC